jgi:hypothetical protein
MRRSDTSDMSDRHGAPLSDMGDYRSSTVATSAYCQAAAKAHSSCRAGAPCWPKHKLLRSSAALTKLRQPSQGPFFARYFHRPVVKYLQVGLTVEVRVIPTLQLPRFLGEAALYICLRGVIARSGLQRGARPPSVHVSRVGQTSTCGGPQSHAEHLGHARPSQIMISSTPEPWACVEEGTGAHVTVGASLKAGCVLRRVRLRDYQSAGLRKCMLSCRTSRSVLGPRIALEA